MSELLKISLPDGSVREMPAGSTPADVAAAIGPGLAKAALAARIDGELVDLARPYLGDARIVTSQLKRWRFATPRRIWPDAHWSPDDVAGLAVAGDAFAGPRVEGAALSGLSAAEAIA